MSKAYAPAYVPTANGPVPVHRHVYAPDRPAPVQRCWRSGDWVLLLVGDGINIATRSLTLAEARQLRTDLDYAIEVAR